MTKTIVAIVIITAIVINTAAAVVITTAYVCRMDYNTSFSPPQQTDPSANRIAVVTNRSHRKRRIMRIITICVAIVVMSIRLRSRIVLICPWIVAVVI